MEEGDGLDLHKLTDAGKVKRCEKGESLECVVVWKLIVDACLVRVKKKKNSLPQEGRNIGSDQIL